MSQEPEHEPGTITERTRLPVALAFAIALTAASGTWYVAHTLNQIDRRLELAIADRWTVADMERWAYRLEKSNRDSTPPLVVPEVPHRQPRTD